MHTILLALAITITAQAPSVSTRQDVVPAPVVGAVLGALGGAAVVGGGMLAFSNTCVTTSASCPWGDDGGEIIGAFVMVPAAFGAGLLVGGLAGTVIALHQEHEEALVVAQRRTPSTVPGVHDAIVADDEVPLLPPVSVPPTSPAPSVVASHQPEVLTADQLARIPDDVDSDG